MSCPSSSSEFRLQPIGNPAGDFRRPLVGDRERRTDVDLAKHAAVAVFDHPLAQRADNFLLNLRERRRVPALCKVGGQGKETPVPRENLPIESSSCAVFALESVTLLYCHDGAPHTNN